MQEPKHIRYAREYEREVSEYKQILREYKQTIREYERRQSLAAKTMFELSREVRRLTKEVKTRDELMCCRCFKIIDDLE